MKATRDVAEEVAGATTRFPKSIRVNRSAASMSG